MLELCDLHNNFALPIITIFAFNKFKLKDKNKICKEFNNFCSDATELTIIGNDLDFLLDEKCKPQKDRILKLRDKCTIICTELDNSKISSNSLKSAEEYTKLVELYDEFSRNGVKIRCITNDVKNAFPELGKVLGQIKETNFGKSVKFVTKEGKKFKDENI